MQSSTPATKMNAPNGVFDTPAVLLVHCTLSLKNCSKTRQPVGTRLSCKLRQVLEQHPKRCLSPSPFAACQSNCRCRDKAITFPDGRTRQMAWIAMRQMAYMNLDQLHVLFLRVSNV